MTYPSFYDPTHASEWHYAPCLGSGSGDYRSLIDEARAQEVPSAHTDDEHVELLLVDCQKDFCLPGGGLYVGEGAIADARRISEFIYRNLSQITRITASLDSHFPYHVFSPAFWEPHPDPFTVITDEDILRERYRPRAQMIHHPEVPGNYEWLQKQCLHYCRQLQATGKYQLLIWPEHCLFGSPGWDLVGIIQEAMLFHSYARFAPYVTVPKGSNLLSEHYSILGPESVSRWDGEGDLYRSKDIELRDRLLACDKLIVAGQAASHCVRFTLDDLLSDIQTLKKNDVCHQPDAADVCHQPGPSLASKIYVLTDCMSSISGFEEETERALRAYRDAGMHLIESCHCH